MAIESPHSGRQQYIQAIISDIEFNLISRQRMLQEPDFQKPERRHPLESIIETYQSALDVLQNPDKFKDKPLSMRSGDHPAVIFAKNFLELPDQEIGRYGPLFIDDLMDLAIIDAHPEAAEKFYKQNPNLSALLFDKDASRISVT